MPTLKVPPWMEGMIFEKSDSRYSGVSPSVPATAFIRSTSNPTILPDSSLNSLGAYGMFTPTISLPEALMASGTVFAIASTLSAGAAAVGDSSPPLGSELEQPDSASAPDATMTAATRQNLVRSWIPPNTVSLYFLL